MELLILIFAAFLTSSISAVLGMGGGVILLAIMAVIIPEGYLVIALHGAIQLFSNVTRAIIFRMHIRWDIFKEFFFGASIGLLLSTFVIIGLIDWFHVKSANEIKFDILKPVIGLFILWYLFFKSSIKNVKIKDFYWVGGVSGISSVFIGATGPLIAPFFLNKSLTKENIIANKAACQAVSHIGKIPLFIYFFNVSYYNQLSVIGPLIVAVFIGTNFGKYILQFMPDYIFKKLFRYALVVIAIKLILFNY